MIIINGHVVARPDSIEELRALSLEHVRRSRAEPGCLSHAVHIDAENPLRLVFVETWSDREAVAAHFAAPESQEFVRAARRLAAEPTVIEVYEASPIGV
jgi:quinol monooxygenase YgiN